MADKIRIRPNVSQKVAAHGNGIEKRMAVEAGERLGEHLHASRHCRDDLIAGVDTYADIDHRKAILVGHLVQDSPAAMGVCAAHHEIAIEQSSCYGFIYDRICDRLNGHLALRTLHGSARYQDLWLANIARRGSEQTVEIGRFHLLRVYQEEAANTQPREFFNHHGSGAADADDGDSKAVEYPLTLKAEGPNIAVEHVRQGRLIANTGFPFVCADIAVDFLDAVDRK
ncbi:hypothetical protein X747_22840 [Mesorhizobium sp. LNJC384A00]|nr:hypothetical protein X747_22840 [Mesorhizobium sp. LNJC384A00]